MDFLYIISSDAKSPCKIGVAKDTVKRLYHLQLGSPVELSVIWEREYEDAYFIESETHKELSDKRLKSEWFDIHPSEAIRKILTIAEEKSRHDKEVCSSVNSERPTVAGKFFGTKKQAVRIFGSVERLLIASEMTRECFRLWPEKLIPKQSKLLLGAAIEEKYLRCKLKK